MSGSDIFFRGEEEGANRSRKKGEHENRMEVEGIHSIKRSRRDENLPEPDMKAVGELVSWQNASSRIIRVSRVSGGKDRHSKVWTVKGLRDRRVRLSVSTSMQFYDLQDRLGYDQPSKAVDWLINAAADAIVELPELEAPFPVPPLLAIPGRAILSRRSPAGELQPSRSPVPATAMVDFGSSTSEYLTREIENFGHGHRIPPPETSFSSFMHYGSSPNMGMGMMPYNQTPSGEHQDVHRFSIMQDHAIPVSPVAPDFSSGIAGFARGSLQSNSHHLHHANLPFFLGGAIPVAAVAAAGSLPENQFPGGFNGHLQLFCNEAYMHPELKGDRKG